MSFLHCREVDKCLKGQILKGICRRGLSVILSLIVFLCRSMTHQEIPILSDLFLWWWNCPLLVIFPESLRAQLYCWAQRNICVCVCVYVRVCVCVRLCAEAVGTCGDWRLISIIIDLDACRQAGGVWACVCVCAWVLSENTIEGSLLTFHSSFKELFKWQGF